MMAYNHAPYIAQALDSILTQETSFSVQIVVGEDNSSDDTRTIVTNYAHRYPTQVVALLHDTNIGAGRNQLLVLEACTGKYIAMLEGDDYWTDPCKLQKQIDFLDQNPEYSICFTRVDEEITGQRHVSSLNPWDNERTFSIQDLAQGNIIHTPSVVFRNGLIPNFPSWFSVSPVGDYVLHMLNARKGLIKYFPVSTAVYRKSIGNWSSQSRLIQLDRFSKVINFLLTEDFVESVKVKLKKQEKDIFSSYCEELINNNDLSFIVKMAKELSNESDFIKHWMLVVYPQKIDGILNSKSYKLASMISAAFLQIKKLVKGANYFEK